MPTPGERKALLFFAVLLVAGTGVRVARALGDDPVADGDRAALARQLAAVDAAREAKASGRGRASGAGKKSGGPRQPPARRPRATSRGGVSAEALDPAERSARAAAAAMAERARLEDAWRAERSVVPRRSTAPSPSPATKPGAVIDLDTATPAEIERLPRIGPELARRIVEDRARRGPFGSLQALQRVRGVGPRMTELLRGRVAFSGRTPS